MLIAEQPVVLHVMSRFNLPLGVGEKTIQEFCQQNHVHAYTFLFIVNFTIAYTDMQQTSHIAVVDINAEAHCPDADGIDLATLVTYLKQAHKYFCGFALPMIRKRLVESINYAGDDKIPVLIIRFFDEYTHEINLHMKHENNQLFPFVHNRLEGGKVTGTIETFAHQHTKVDDEHIGAKLTELKNLIIKYWNRPLSTFNEEPLLHSTLFDIFSLERDFATHCALEDEVLIPAMRRYEQTKMEQKILANNRLEDVEEELSDREKDVLRELVKGKSNKEIAASLYISTHTVISHRKNIVKKLNIKSVAGLTIYSLVNKIVEL